jgi:hypothetical protein
MADPYAISHRSRLTTQLLAFFLGMFGAHRFYVGKIQTGLLMLVTLGGLGIWWLVDNIVILGGGFRDAEGLLVHDWDPEPRAIPGQASVAAILDELDQLRAEVAELNERVDFTERMLADPGRTRQDP